MDVYEVLRLVKLGKSNRTIASVLGINRKTVGKHRGWAEQNGLLVGDLPDPYDLYQLLQEPCPATLSPASALGLFASVALASEQAMTGWPRH